MKNSTSSQSVIRTLVSSLVFVAGLLLPGTASAQLKSTDGSTPLALSPGAPAGSYALSGFENVNLYNGHLNFSLPLLQIAGRGSASYPITLRIEPKWLVENGPLDDSHPTGRYSPVSNWWTLDNAAPRRYSIGRLDIRQGGSREYSVCGSSGFVHNSTLTRLTFTAPDGTEYELRDQLTNGAPQQPSRMGCAAFNRGRVFVTADGTSATFISDVDISDYNYDNPANIPPSGYILLRDGTRFRVKDDGTGLISWMRDRNGNQLTFTYDASYRITSVTDSLNRTVTITYTTASVPYDEITYLRSGNVTRSIKVHLAALSAATLRSDFAPQTEKALFPELNGAFDNVYPGQGVVSALELPTGQRYQFKYDSYGELARVVLPTGGAIEYDYAPGLSDRTGSGVLSRTNDKQVYRRVIKRRVYPNGETGAAFATETTYSRPESNFMGTSTTSTGYVRTETRDANGQRLELSDHYFQGSAALSLFQQPIQYPAYRDGREYRTEVFTADGTTVLRRVENFYTQPAVAWWTGNAEAAPPNNPRLVATVTTIEPSGANLVTKQTFDYDQYNNQTDVYEYDYGQGAAPATWARHSHTDYVTTNNGVDYASPNPTAASIHIRNLPAQQSVFNSNNTEKARTTYEYDNYSGASHAGLTPRSFISGLDASYTAAYAYRGNVTALTNWLLPNTPLTSYLQYDVAGNVVKSIDARGAATEVSYDDNFGTQNAEARTNTTPPELSGNGRQSYAYPTKITNALGHAVYTQYDYWLGAPVEVEDANGVVSSGYYDDPLDRPTQVIVAANQGATVKSQSSFSYDDVNRVITTTKDRAQFNDPAPLKSQVIYDQMGRTTETRHYETDTSYIDVQTVYDALGRVAQVTNPYWAGETVCWTTSSYDELGRVAAVRTPDNAIVGTAYYGNQVLVTDQAGKQRLSRTNALGQLTDVWEITAQDSASVAVNFFNHAEVTAGYLTHYDYDTLDNLTTVTQRVGTQGTTQTRSFTYDSLKRLTSAFNPESGTVTYEYDNNGNLLHKTDARSIQTACAYDELNRITSLSYLNEPAQTQNASGDL